MDKEQQLYDAKKHPSRSTTGWNILTVTTAIISSVSLIIAVAAIALVYVQMRSVVSNTDSDISQREIISVLYTPADPQRKTQMLKTIATTLEAHDMDMSAFSRQTRRTKRKSCNSSMDGNTPVAHIVATGLGEKTVHTEANAYPVLSTKWSCSDTSNGYIKGGMFYNPTTGFLRVPVDGAYFLYSQIVVKGTTQTLGHSSVLCKCVGKTNCECTSDDSDSTSITSSMEVEPFMESLQSVNNDVASNYHGGIRYLKAGDQVALIPPNQYTGSYVYITQQTKAFFGAFLVSKLPEKNPAPSPPLPSYSPSPSPGN